MSTTIGAGEFVAVLGSRPDTMPACLPGSGPERFTSLSRALAGDVPASGVLLLDEPFAGLDPPTRLELQESLLRVWQESGATVVLVTHDVDEALYLADRIVLMSAGAAPVGEVLDVPFSRPRARDAVLDDSRYCLFRRRVIDMLRARAAAGAGAAARAREDAACLLRPKPDRRQLLMPMPPALERRGA